MNISLPNAECSLTLISRPESWADVRDGPIMDRLEDYAPEQSAGQRTAPPESLEFEKTSRVPKIGLRGSWAPWRSLVVPQKQGAAHGQPCVRGLCPQVQRNHRLKVLVGGLPRTMTIGGGACIALGV